MARAAELPPLPEADSDGYVPAIEFGRASIARTLIRERVEAGMSQRELARRSGIRFETICRLEKERHTPSIPTLEKLDRAIKEAGKKMKPSQARKVRKG